MITVEEFKNRWIKNNRPIRVPFKNAIHVTDIAYALCLYREENYQVELYICRADTESPMHSHPGVESISMYLTGDLQFFREGEPLKDLSKYQIEDANGFHPLLGCISEINDGTKEHALKIGKTGGAFLIFERWSDQLPTSVTTNWKGELVGDIHKKTMESVNVE